MTIQRFTSLLNACRKVNDYISKLYSLGISINDNCPIYMLIDSIIAELDEEFNTDLVSYYFYERDCNGIEMNGKPTPLCWEEDNKEIWIESDEELYIYLKKNKDEG